MVGMSHLETKELPWLVQRAIPNGPSLNCVLNPVVLNFPGTTDIGRPTLVPDLQASNRYRPDEARVRRA